PSLLRSWLSRDSHRQAALRGASTEAKRTEAEDQAPRGSQARLHTPIETAARLAPVGESVGRDGRETRQSCWSHWGRPQRAAQGSPGKRPAERQLAALMPPAPQQEDCHRGSPRLIGVAGLIGGLGINSPRKSGTFPRQKGTRGGVKGGDRWR